MKSYIVEKVPVIILDFNLLFWPLSQNTVVPFSKGQEAQDKTSSEEFHHTFLNVLRAEVMQSATLFGSLFWGRLPRHLLE